MYARSVLRNQAYTLIEVLLVIAMIGTLLTISTISLSQIQLTTYVSTSVETVLSDIKFQQTKAMNGDTDGTGTTSRYGIHFETDTYTLFRGDTYTAGDPEHFVVKLQGNAGFGANSFPGGQVVFEKGSGEVVGFTPGNNTVTLQNPGSTITITLNALGVITGVH